MASFFSSVLLAASIGGGGGSGSVAVPANETWVLKFVSFNNEAGGDNFWQIEDGLGFQLAGGAVINASGGLAVNPGSAASSFFSDANLNGNHNVAIWHVLEPGDTLVYRAGDATQFRVSGYRLPQ